MPYVRNAAVIWGFPAAYLARLLRFALRDEGAMHRDLARQLNAALRDLEQTADAWQRERTAEDVAPEPPPALPDEIDTGEVAALLGLKGTRWVTDLINRGEIVGRKVSGGRWLVDRASVLAYRERRTTAA